MVNDLKKFRELITGNVWDTKTITKLLKANGMTVKQTKRRCYDVRYLTREFETVHCEVMKIKLAERKARLKAMADLGIKKKKDTFQVPAGCLKITFYMDDGSFKEVNVA